MLLYVTVRNRQLIEIILIVLLIASLKLRKEQCGMILGNKGYCKKHKKHHLLFGKH